MLSGAFVSCILCHYIVSCGNICISPYENKIVRFRWQRERERERERTTSHWHASAYDSWTKKWTVNVPTCLYNEKLDMCWQGAKISPSFLPLHLHVWWRDNIWLWAKQITECQNYEHRANSANIEFGRFMDRNPGLDISNEVSRVVPQSFRRLLPWNRLSPMKTSRFVVILTTIVLVCLSCHKRTRFFQPSTKDEDHYNNQLFNFS
jgi:hypothetical protein